MTDPSAAIDRCPTLTGRVVRLEPLDTAHVDALWEVGQDAELWRWTLSQVRSMDDMRAYVATALAERDRGQSIPFAQVEVATGRVIGSTRFGNIEPAHRRVEIGWTWIGAPWQRSGVNTEAKRLLLGHAFDVLGLARVEIKTDALNTRSRAAIRRLGAAEEGVLRSHMVTESGRRRDTVYYSVLAAEWPAVRSRLDRLLDRANSDLH